MEDTITANLTSASGNLNEKPNVNHMIVLRELRSTGKVSIAEKWVPLDLSQENHQERDDYCESLLTRQLQMPIFFFTGDEKSILYQNFKRRHQCIS